MFPCPCLQRPGVWNLQDERHLLQSHTKITEQRFKDTWKWARRNVRSSKIYLQLANKIQVTLVDQLTLTTLLVTLVTQPVWFFSAGFFKRWQKMYLWMDQVQFTWWGFYCSCSPVVDRLQRNWNLLVLHPAPSLVPPQCSQFAVCVRRLSSSLLIWSVVRTDGHVIQLDYRALLWLLGRRAASVRLLAAPDVCRHLWLWSGDEEQQPDMNASSDLMKTDIVFPSLPKRSLLQAGTTRKSCFYGKLAWEN